MSNPNPNKENRFTPKDWAAVPTKEIISLLGSGISLLMVFLTGNTETENLQMLRQQLRLIELWRRLRSTTPRLKGWA